MKFVGGKTSNLTNDPPVGDVDLIVASLGVLSKLVTWKIFDMKLVRHIILDEADVLLDPTFRTKMCSFLDKLPVYKLFSLLFYKIQCYRKIVI